MLGIKLIFTVVKIPANIKKLDTNKNAKYIFSQRISVGVGYYFKFLLNTIYPQGG